MVLEDFPDNGVSRQKNKAAGRIGQGSGRPKRGDVRKKKPAQNSAQQCCGLDRNDTNEDAPGGQSGPSQQGAEGQPFRNFMDADGEDDGKADNSLGRQGLGVALVTGRHGQSIDRAMNGQGEHHGRGDFTKTMGGGFIKVARRASRANVEDILADYRKKNVAGSQGQQQLPPAQVCDRFGQDGKNGHAQKRAGAEANQGAQTLVRRAQHRAERSSSNRQRKGQHDTCKGRAFVHIFKTTSVTITRQLSSFFIFKPGEI